MKNRVITVQDVPITVAMSDSDDYICIMKGMHLSL